MFRNIRIIQTRECGAPTFDLIAEGVLPRDISMSINANMRETSATTEYRIEFWKMYRFCSKVGRRTFIVENGGAFDRYLITEGL